MAKRNTVIPLGTAATKNVGAGPGQIPDISNYPKGSGWFKLPSGHIVQYGKIPIVGSGTTALGITEYAQTSYFPIAFPTECTVQVSRWQAGVNRLQWVSLLGSTSTSLSFIVGYDADVQGSPGFITYHAIGR